MPTDSRVWLARAQRLRAIAQIGQTYTRDRYDRERFDELASIANEMLADLTDAPLEAIVGIYLPERGYPTPKVDVRAGVFNDAGDVLLVREASDRTLGTTGRLGRRTRLAEARLRTRSARRVRLSRHRDQTRRHQRPLDAPLHAAAPRTHLQTAVPLLARRRHRRHQRRDHRRRLLPTRRTSPICPLAAHLAADITLLSAHRSVILSCRAISIEAGRLLIGLVTADRCSGDARAIPGALGRGHPWPRMPLRTDQPSPSTFERNAFVQKRR